MNLPIRRNWFELDERKGQTSSLSSGAAIRFEALSEGDRL